MLVPLVLLILIGCIVILFLQTRVLRIRCTKLEEEVSRLKEANEPTTTKKTRSLPSKEEKKNDSVDVPLGKLVRQMSSSDSFPTIKKLRGKRDEDYFAGHQAVSWLCRHYNLTRSAAATTCQKMMDSDLMEHEEGAEKFKDSAEEFYRFCAGDDPNGSNNYLFRLSNTMKTGLAEDHMEGYLEIFALAFWHKNYFVQKRKELKFYNCPPDDGGIHLGTITLDNTKMLDVKREHLSFELGNETVANIFTIHGDKELPVCNSCER